MLKVMAFLVKKQGLDTGDLIDYYERHHVPLILSLAPAPTTYKRNYLMRDAAVTGLDDFDIVAELVFPRRLPELGVDHVCARIRRRRGRNDVPRSDPDEILRR
jgi:hypothetical protein